MIQDLVSQFGHHQCDFQQEQRGRAIGTWSTFTSLTMALGPVLG